MMLDDWMIGLIILNGYDESQILVNMSGHNVPPCVPGHFGCECHFAPRVLDESGRLHQLRASVPVHPGEYCNRYCRKDDTSRVDDV